MSSTAEPAKSPGQNPNQYEDAEQNYQPKSLRFWLIMLSMYMAMFLVALDRTIIATAIPSITDDFNSIGDIGWYGSAYMLTVSSFILIFGRIYQLYHTKWVFLLSMVIFEVGSAICGAAPSSTVFIIGRAIAGLGAAGIQAGGMMIILPHVPLRKRPVFVSIFGMVFGIASVVAPIIGGSFTDYVTWRWCFYFNLPVGGFTLVATLFFLRIKAPEGQRPGIVDQIKRLDPIGVLLFIPSIVCLILALEWGGTTYAWSAPKIIGLLVTFAVLFVAFIVFEALTPETAMTPTRIILNRSIAGSMFFMFFLGSGMISIIYYLNIWFQVVKADSATDAGLSTIPIVLAMVVVGFLAAAITQRIGYYVPSMLVGPLFTSIGAGLLSTLSSSSGHSHWIGYQVLYGVGMGCGFQTANLAAQTVLSRPDVPIGIALMFFVQQLGGSIFLAVDQNVVSNKLVDRLSNVGGLDANVIVNTGATDLRKIVPSGALSTVIEAYNYALTRVFIIAAAISACAILGALATEWRSIKGEGGKGQSEGKETEKAT